VQARRMKLSAIIVLIVLISQCSVGDKTRKEKYGMSIFLGHCSTCHGKDAAGQDPLYPDGRWLDNGVQLAPALNEKGHIWMYPPELIFQRIKTGLLDEEPIMPTFENSMSDQEITVVIQYLYSLWPEDIKKRYIEKYRDSQIVKEI
jgi:mono/diheme cytochrome c family protein